MNKREMANELMLRANRLRAQSGSPAFEAEAAINEAASEALRREAEREEQERPKVTLEEQIKACMWASGNNPPQGVKLAAAADTLRYLAEGGGGLLKAQDQADRGSVGPSTLAYAQFLRSLGVEPKP